MYQIYQQNLLTNSMTSRRLKTETIEHDNQKSVRSICIEKQHFFQQNRKKYKFSNANPHSLHSIDTKRSSINLYQNTRIKYPQRRRQLSIPVNQPKHILTQRPQMPETTSKKFSENRLMFPLKQQRIHTHGDEDRLQARQKKIKNCIEVMCGVLQEIRNEKSSNKISKTKIIEQFSNHCREIPKNAPEGGQSKFQNYVKSIAKLKQCNKMIIIKRGKSKSTINNQNIPNSNLNSKSFLPQQKQTPSLETPQPPMRRNIEQPIQRPKKSQPLKLQEISCSSIQKGNQSSFVSEFSRQSFIKGILEPEEQAEAKKLVKFKNSKQLKQLFPVDFF